MHQPITDQEFEQLRAGFESGYKKIDQIRCPYFNEPVTFNAKGFEHIRFARKNHARVREEQALRMRLFPLAAEILKLSKTIQGITHTQHFEIVRTNQRNETNMLPVSYFEFIAILNEKRVRVIVKQIDGGPKFFWSVIPFWKMDRMNGRRRMAYGNPETD